MAMHEQGYIQQSLANQHSKPTRETAFSALQRARNAVLELGEIVAGLEAQLLGAPPPANALAGDLKAVRAGILEQAHGDASDILAAVDRSRERLQRIADALPIY